jgi:hypothetical protein
MKTINLTPVFRKFKPTTNFNEQYIFNRRINQRKNDINKLFTNFETEEESKIKQIKVNVFSPKRSIITSKRKISSFDLDDNLFASSEKKRIKNSLFDKINFGSLEYFDYIERKNSPNSKKVFSQKVQLLNSKNFEFGRSNLSNNNTFYNSNTLNNNSNNNRNDNNNNFYKTVKSFRIKSRKKINKNLITHRNQSSSIPIKTLNTNKTENKTFSTIFNITNNDNVNNIDLTQASLRENNIKYYMENNNNDIKKNTIFNSKIKISRNMNKKTSILKPKNSTSSTLMLKEKIKSSIKNFDTNIKKNEDELIKLIHKIETKKKLNKEIDIKKREINEILGIKKINKKSNSLEITGIMGKNGLVNAINSSKAKMLMLSDRINKLTDEVAIKLVGNIGKEYNQESKNAGIGFLTFEDGEKIDLSKKNNTIIQMIKKQMIYNSRKIKKMKFQVDLENTKFQNKHFS